MALGDGVMKRRGRVAMALDEVLLEVRLLVERRWRTARKSVKLLSCREVRRVDVEGARREAEAQRSTRLITCYLYDNQGLDRPGKLNCDYFQCTGVAVWFPSIWFTSARYP